MSIHSQSDITCTLSMMINFVLSMTKLGSPGSDRGFFCDFTTKYSQSSDQYTHHPLLLHILWHGVCTDQTFIVHHYNGSTRATTCQSSLQDDAGSGNIVQ
jgi:hypothetical protein